MAGEGNIRAVVIGESNVDLILRSSRPVEPRPGREIEVEDAEIVIGSSSAIFACQMARLGATVNFVSRVGNDALGTFFLDSMRRKGVETGLVRISSDVPTGITVSLSSPAERALVTYPGTIAATTAADVPDSVFAAGAHLHLASYFLQKGLRKSFPDILSRAKKAGMTTSFDSGCDPEENWQGFEEVIPHVDVLLLNEVEAANVPESLKPRVPVFVRKLGAQGAEMVFKGAKFSSPAPRMDKVVDTTGAGDSFDAAFVYAWLSGMKPDELLPFACAAGTLSTRGKGGTATQGTVREIVELLGKGDA